MASNKSKHILTTSSNLLGFCLVVLTSLKISNYSSVTLIDEFTGVATLLLMASSLLSFLSIRAKKDSHSLKFERVADLLFIIALVSIFVITFMIAFSILF